MRLIVVSLLLLAIAANGFGEEDIELPSEEEEPGNEIETRNDDQRSENEVLTTALKKEDTEPKNEVGSPVQTKVPEKKGKGQKILAGLKKMTKTIASGVKKGAKKTASLTKKGVKLVAKGVKKGTKALNKRFKNKRDD